MPKTVRRLLTTLRPLEWATLAFILFAMLYAGPSVVLQWRQLAGLRTVQVLCALGVVAAVILGRLYRNKPWTPDTQAPRRFHWVLLPICLAPMILAGLIALTTPSLRNELSNTRLAGVLPVLSTIILTTLGFGLPTLLLWLALGLNVKEHGALKLGRFAKQNAKAFATMTREWAPILFILSAYAWMAAVVGQRTFDEKDAWMLAADKALFFGRDPQDLVQQLINRPLSEWLAFAYAFYAILFPLVLGVVFMFGGRRALRESSFALGVALLIGYVSYSLVPVKGPVLSRTYEVPLDLYLIGPIKEALMDATRITYDCFPSMHTCCTLLLGWAAWRHTRRLFWVLSPIIFSMPFACVYLRYHYVVDVLAGALLAGAMVALTIELRPRLLADLPPLL